MDFGRLELALGSMTDLKLLTRARHDPLDCPAPPMSLYSEAVVECVPTALICHPCAVPDREVSYAYHSKVDSAGVCPRHADVPLRRLQLPADHTDHGRLYAQHAQNGRRPELTGSQGR